jgi:hypothetical protein
VHRPRPPGPPARGTYVLAAVANSQLPPELVLTVRTSRGRWSAWTYPHRHAGGASREHERSVAVAGHTTAGSDMPFNLHVFEAGEEGILHARLSEHGIWAPFADVTEQAGERGETFFGPAAVGFFAFPEGPGPYDVVDLYAGTLGRGLLKATRTGNGAWSPFVDVRTSFGYNEPEPIRHLATDWTVGPSGLTEELVVSDAGLWHLRLVRRQDGTRYSMPPSRLRPSGLIGPIGCAVSRGPLPVLGGEGNIIHVCHSEDGVSANPGNLQHRAAVELPFWPGGLGWTDWADVPGRGPEGYFNVACSAARGELHVCALMYGTRRLYHTVRRPDGSWDPWIDVQVEAGDVGGGFTDVAVLAG